jgi:hypothetical protein
VRPRTERATEGGLRHSAISDYFPPCSVLLRQANLTPKDIQGTGSVAVPRSFLRALISELLSCASFDENWYGRRYPDVEGARLAGDIKSLHDHFKTAGYFEGRLPAEPPFDADWYRKHYRDLADAFDASDSEGLQRHYVVAGYYEGRAGSPDSLAELERWSSFANS